MTISGPTRSDAVAAAHGRFDSGQLFEELAARVQRRTVSTDPSLAEETEEYFRADLGPAVQAMGFTWNRFDNPASSTHPFFVAERIEEDAAFTVLMYGHADVQPPQTGQWRDGLDPWTLTVDGDRWYGRGSADNKAQHTINLAALDEVIRLSGGTLGYSVKLLVESGEEAGSPGLSQFCADHREELAADVFLASDGPRMSAETPTVFLGSRGTTLIRLEVDERDRAHHSGNWGGVLSNAGTILAHALASLVDARGRILVDALRPTGIDDAVRRATSTLRVGSDPGDPALTEGWGEPGLSPAERLFAWNTLEILDFLCGDPHQPVGAIPGSAHADLQFRCVVGSTDAEAVVPAIRAHLQAAGLDRVKVVDRGGMTATRLSPEDPWAQLALASLEETTGKAPALVPNLAGTIPNGAFADVLGLPTVWVPHSYPGCAQHAPNEHVLASLTREAMGIMAGLLWDLRSHRP
ncbi:M20 family metallopeptidase [Brevibacterium yomogidense]|uniref:M20 family metallopeptidase n=1 Tax=Brevibacterium yomogidense TaxID=946573 RepID=UPI0018DFEBCF|nr:M20 family metallopeptidase [Brevibacterium yomogidense]